MKKVSLFIVLNAEKGEAKEWDVYKGYLGASMAADQWVGEEGVHCRGEDIVSYYKDEKRTAYIVEVPMEIEKAKKAYETLDRL